MKEKLYYSLSAFLKERFGERVRKIPLDAGLLCPNRDGTKGYGGCIYCNPRGSGTGLSLKGVSLKEQLTLFLENYKKKGFKKFIAYFQSFSNTYAPPELLDRIYSVVFSDSSIVGIAIGTRPDCINQEVIKVLKKYQKLGYYLWIELGLQSKHNKTLKLINRGHTLEDFVEAYEILKQNDFPVVVHIIFGLPGETEEMMLETIVTLSELKVDGVKFHSLYIVKGSKMDELYQRGEYVPLEMEEYAYLVARSLTLLPPKTVIHRLTSEAKIEEISGPLWASTKHQVINKIHRILLENDWYQGKFYPYLGEAGKKV
ncbi:MAG: TIGR01212 family radical SAM protein [Thermodesulfobacteriaceae bacterium]|nr:TIGR01212 family radical SAM protein [Thermodesulfobacteriaceae bacterium]